MASDGGYRKRPPPFNPYSNSGNSGSGANPGRAKQRMNQPKADRAKYDGKSKRPAIIRKAVDFHSVAINYVVVCDIE